MASNKNDNIRLLAPKNLDDRKLHPSNRAWASISEALNGITYRAPYLWVVIAGKLYWFQGGIADGDLVEFLPEIDIPEIVNNLTTNDSSKTLGADMGVLLKSYIDAINEILTSDDTTLDELQEIVDYIKQNKEVLETLAISNIAGLQTALANLQTAIDGKENSFSKNTAFNKNFGTGSEDVPRGNDSRINNGQTAYTWGDHAQAGYQKALISNPDIYIDEEGNIYPNITDFTENFTWSSGSKIFNLNFHATAILFVMVNGSPTTGFNFTEPSQIEITDYMESGDEVSIYYQHYINVPE